MDAVPSELSRRARRAVGDVGRVGVSVASACRCVEPSTSMTWLALVRVAEQATRRPTGRRP